MMESSGPADAALAGRLIVGLEGVWPTDDEWHWLRQWHPAGIILFSRNVDNFSQLKNLCSSLKNWVPGLEIMADHEGGPVSQLASAIGRPPVAWSLGILDDVDATRRVHEETGRRMKLAGLDRVLGPCADVMSEPRNPVIGARAFGAQSDLVSRHVAAAVEGLIAAGVSCCLKHWPGHGGSGTDSHLETTAVRITPDDEHPFRCGLKAGADAVMAGHLLFDETRLPATLSPTFLEKTKNSLGTGGSDFVLMADDVSMGGLREPMAGLGISLAEESSETMVDVANLTVPWFEKLVSAGCDRLLLRTIPYSAFPLKSETTKIDISVPASHLLSIVENGSEDVRFDDLAYGETRHRRLSDFFTSTGDLVFLDLSRHDRWQVAGGLGAEHWVRWNHILSSNFSKIRKNENLDAAIQGAVSISNLLVTTHRPMPRDWETRIWAQSLRVSLSETGHCLVMGHPSLAAEFEAFLGGKWAVDALYDICCEEVNVIDD